jgi:hypothetical protein
MNPLISRLYPSLKINPTGGNLRDIMQRKCSSGKVSEQSPNGKPSRTQASGKEYIKEQPKEQPKEKPMEQEVNLKEESKSKSNLDKELDDYIEQLEKDYKPPSPKPRKSSAPINPRKKENDEEKKARIIKGLSRKRVSTAEKQVKEIQQVFEDHSGDENKLKQKEKELRRGILLIRQARVLNNTGDLQKNNNIDNIENNETINSE